LPDFGVGDAAIDGITVGTGSLVGATVVAGDFVSAGSVVAGSFVCVDDVVGTVVAAGLLLLFVQPPASAITITIPITIAAILFFILVHSLCITGVVFSFTLQQASL
jgi:hypothetical protein